MPSPEEIAQQDRTRPAGGGDAKYGHLYTDDDLLLFTHRVIDKAARAEPGTSVRQIFEGAVDELVANDQLRFPLDEPLFLLRGKDSAIHKTMREYALEVVRQLTNLKPPEAQAIAAKTVANAVSVQASRILRWQIAHQDRCKLPD